MIEIIFGEIKVELLRQDSLHGVNRDQTPETWLTILIEEVGEAAKSILEGDSVNYEKELIQIASVAVATLKALRFYRSDSYLGGEHDGD